MSVSVDWTQQRQGARVSLPGIPVAMSDEHPTPLGVAIISQDCDVVLPKSPNVVVGKIVAITDDLHRRQCADYQSPRWVPLPLLGTEFFIDLEYVATVPKAVILPEMLLGPAVDATNHFAARKLAGALGRRFSRFPFPDDLHRQINRLQRKAQDRYRTDRPMGKTFQQISELRLGAAGGWDEFPLSLTLHVVLELECLPLVEERAAIEDAYTTEKTAGRIRRRNPGDIAGVLFPPGGDRPELTAAYRLWLEFADALIADWPEDEFTESIEALVTDPDSFTMSAIRASESLDLDYLSPPLPL